MKGLRKLPTLGYAEPEGTVPTVFLAKDIVPLKEIEYGIHLI